MPLTINKIYKSLPYFVLFTGIFVSLLAGLYTYNYYKEKENLQLDAQSNETKILITTRMAAYEQVLKSCVAFFYASEFVSRNEWAKYISGQKINENFKGIQGLGYNEAVQHSNKQEHEQRIQKEGIIDYFIKPQGEREFYTPVVYVEPMNEPNKKALGFDVFSEKTRKEAITRAMLEGKASITKKVTLIQENSKNAQAGFLMFMPVYKKHHSTTTPQERMQAIEGFISAAFRMDDLMDGILNQTFENLHYEIYDGELVGEDTLLYDSHKNNEDTQVYKKSLLNINGHKWTLLFRQDISVVRESLLIAFSVSFVVMLFSSLMFFLLRSLVMTKENALTLAKEATEGLRTSEERLRFALEGSGDGLWDWNLQTNEVYFSRRWKEMIGFKEEEIQNTLEEWKDRVHPKDLEKVYEDITAHIEGRTLTYANEHRMKCKDGSFKWILDRGMIVSRDEKGNPLRMVGSHTDISERKESQIKLDEYLSIIDKNVISSSTDMNGNIVNVSQAFCEISGYKKEELIGENHRILRDPDTHKALYEDLWKTILAGKIWEGEIKNRRKDGGFYWVKSTIVPEYNKEKKLTGYSSVRHDITPQKAKEEFMANMSHELRTPLNAIIGFSRILDTKLQESEFKKLSTQINQSSHALLKLVNDILDLSKIKDSNFSIKPYEFHAYNEIVNLSSQIEGLTSAKILHLHTHIGESLQGMFFGDWDRISQIILNLISNAIKFTPEDGTIEFKIDFEDSFLVFEITDNGIGMNQEVQNRIFRPFEQADGSTTRKYGGTGLGLCIAQSLVELMEGAIRLESQEGVGTTFSVRVALEKISDQELKQLEADTLEILPLHLHVLVAEDNKTNQMLIKMILEDFGVTCDIANDGVEAVQMYNHQKHSLILMDENMPNMNGLEAMKKIKQKYSNALVIALTANAMHSDRERFLSLGMDAYVAKPIDTDELYKNMKNLLEKTT